MNAEKIKAFALRHKWAVIGGAVGLGIVIFVLIRRGTSGTTTQNKTITQAQAEKLDQDINNLETKLENRSASTVNAAWSSPTPSGFPQSLPTSIVPPVSGKGETQLPEEWELSSHHELEPTWSFMRYTDLFVPINGTDRFEDVGARLN
jgi:hypothetical protein